MTKIEKKSVITLWYDKQTSKTFARYNMNSASHIKPYTSSFYIDEIYS